MTGDKDLLLVDYLCSCHKVFHKKRTHVQTPVISPNCRVSNSKAAAAYIQVTTITTSGGGGSGQTA